MKESCPLLNGSVQSKGTTDQCRSKPVKLFPSSQYNSQTSTSSSVTGWHCHHSPSPANCFWDFQMIFTCTRFC